MSLRAIPLDLSLIRQALTIEHEFGTASLLELARVAQFLEHAFYVPSSLVRTPTGGAFRMANPPLRVGAFERVRLRVDGTLLPPERGRIGPDLALAPIPFHQIDRSHPMTWMPGESKRIEFDLSPFSEGRHELRLELQNIAVPPLVWIEISDGLHPDVGRT